MAGLVPSLPGACARRGSPHRSQAERPGPARRRVCGGRRSRRGPGEPAGGRRGSCGPASARAAELALRRDAPRVHPGRRQRGARPRVVARDALVPEAGARGRRGAGGGLRLLPLDAGHEPLLVARGVEHRVPWVVRYGVRRAHLGVRGRCEAVAHEGLLGGRRGRDARRRALPPAGERYVDVVLEPDQLRIPQGHDVYRGAPPLTLAVLEALRRSAVLGDDGAPVLPVPWQAVAVGVLAVVSLHPHIAGDQDGRLGAGRQQHVEAIIVASPHVLDDVHAGAQGGGEREPRHVVVLRAALHDPVLCDGLQPGVLLGGVRGLHVPRQLPGRVLVLPDLRTAAGGCRRLPGAPPVGGPLEEKRVRTRQPLLVLGAVSPPCCGKWASARPSNVGLIVDAVAEVPTFIRRFRAGGGGADVLVEHAARVECDLALVGRGDDGDVDV
mmetsp:Transcript_40724/g.115262  ORF Transcript_40724/g.115262 Transcript_40724/m.115262 type:complete len:440 (+) Transcript_40724:378-1697(+)